ncbi:hypothetical protein H4S02_002888 [Coemansia sp. RSA 2611]|nr:hypothetical protein IWW54_004480 [Coemansia sp. RSA 2705]KAJ2317393.1 hypothetical protein IWW52_003154 [Coemansia sp. RSA 2704]KAJ2365827.1 hypothetical protein H4S01_003032 [Coemansia sp. RSA 2610]KAJ2388404.1 hypothetical protein H4S02_002888 [Coemansia sp. RSA 2611]KAJ2731750.1 hypothetical protein H4R23_003003 [Coemansia sp. Cherry 401B]
MALPIAAAAAAAVPPATKRELSAASLKEYVRAPTKLPTAVYRRVAQYCDSRARRQLAQVSQSWRALVAPLLWETVCVYDYADDVAAAAAHVHSLYRDHVRHIQFQSRRSRRDVPKWLDSPAEIAMFGAWLEVEWPRVESMFVRFLYTPVDIRAIDLPRNLPTLGAVAVENSYLPWRDIAKWALTAPQMCDLSVAYAKDLKDCDRRRFAHLLADYNVLQATQGPGFTRLRMQYQPDEMGIFYASILRTQPKLRELRIDSIPAAQLEALAKQLAFPSSIETLCLGIETTESLPPLVCLTPRALPRLSRLMVRCNTNPLSHCHIALDEFAKHSWPRLRSLVVSVLTNDQCRKLPTICPNLEVLIVQPGSPAEHQIHNVGLEALLMGLRRLRRLHVVQQISPIGEMLSDAFVWKATHFEPPKVLSLRKSRRWESWAPKLASSPWACDHLQDLSLCGVYLSFPALVQLLSTLPRLANLKVCIRASTVGTIITPRMFEPWGRHSRLRSLVIDDIGEADLPRLRQFCEFMPGIRNCRIVSQKEFSIHTDDLPRPKQAFSLKDNRDPSFTDSTVSLKR